MKKWKRKPGGFGRLRRLPSGKFQASFKGLDGVTYKAPSTFILEDVAERWLADQEHSIKVAELTGQPWKSPTADEQESMTVNELIEDWLENSPNITKESTRQTSRSGLRLRVIENPLGQEQINAVDTKRIEAWWKELQANKGKNIRANSIAYKKLRTAFNWAVKKGYLKDNPVFIENAFRLTDKEEELVEAKVQKPVLTIQQTKLIAANMPSGLQAPTALMFWTGIRISELLDLKRGDFEDDGEVMTVQIKHSAYPVKNKETGKYEMYSSSPKTKRSKRPLVVPAKVAHQVRNHLKTMVGKKKTDLFVTSSRGLQMTSATYRKYFKAAGGLAGRGDIGPHDARRFLLSTLVDEAGMSLAEAARIAGHKSTKTTAVYMRTRDGFEQRAAARLDELL